jgi:hypothetical protein
MHTPSSRGGPESAFCQSLKPVTEKCIQVEGGICHRLVIQGHAMEMFDCHNCKNESRYRSRKRAVRLEFKQFGRETRTYVCEVCGADNEINLSDFEWDEIDAEN